MSQRGGSTSGLGETFLKVSAPVRQGRLLNQEMGVLPQENSGSVKTLECVFRCSVPISDGGCFLKAYLSWW